ncbi:dipeptide epimerase [Podospora aff. communis PSN243]|uniref:Dipeptide epimerase n=1 Tax=Podospora aff. communis PSN243 TaxID=3040156 RepID=A0AAV9GT38_9PEZI|nr:dipeptide epimerase [Podospora aff. communis PSN243]
MELTCKIETFPFKRRFAISRSTRTETRVVTVTIHSGDKVGRGECVPADRYGETVEGVVAEVELVARLVQNCPDRGYLQTLLPPGAARNAIDCALWDLEAKRGGHRCLEQAGLYWCEPVTAFSISLDDPVVMASAAEREATRPLLKLKLGGGKEDEARVRAVRKAAPAATLIVDANESWKEEDFPLLLGACQKADVKWIEQPFPAGADGVLRDTVRTIPICADESIRDRSDLAGLRDRYDAVNIKLDKAGGLTEALETMTQARALGFRILIGSTVGTSLAMAPALLLAKDAEYVDLDGPLLLDRDREVGLVYDGSIIRPPDGRLWG